MKTKILIIEDDPHILLGLEEVLKSDGFDVAACNRGDHALDAANKHRPDLIVLDVMLPGKSGYDICRELRGRKVSTPILMLTAKGQEIDKVVGLDRSENVSTETGQNRRGTHRQRAETIATVSRASGRSALARPSVERGLGL